MIGQHDLKLNYNRGNGNIMNHKYNPDKYIYLASFCLDTFINNDSLRNMLYNINSDQS